MMAKLDPVHNHYYPSPAKTGALHDDFRKLFDGLYATQDRLKSTESQLTAMTAKHDALAKQVTAGGPSSTKIAGLNVHAAPPNDADRLTYSAATGEIVWKP
jgi:hypothetical protein